MIVVALHHSLLHVIRMEDGERERFTIGKSTPQGRWRRHPPGPPSVRGKIGEGTPDCFPSLQKGGRGASLGTWSEFKTIGGARRTHSMPSGRARVRARRAGLLERETGDTRMLAQGVPSRGAIATGQVPFASVRGRGLVGFFGRERGAWSSFSPLRCSPSTLTTDSGSCADPAFGA